MIPATVGVNAPINTEIKLANYLTPPYTIDRNSHPYYFNVQPNRFTHPEKQYETSEYFTTTETQNSTVI
jgi:hypothetical protein